VHKIGAVARYEFVGAVTRLGYLLTLVGMPAFLACLITVTSLASVRSARESLSRKRIIGIVDESGIFASTPPSVELDGPGMVKIPGDEGMAAQAQRLELKRFA